MCGLVGFYFNNNEFQRNELAHQIGKMISALSHRGPDGTGVWIDDSSGIALGHARLSILDLSSNGSQPMISSSNRYTIVFNGEIYNHLDLRARLAFKKKIPWRGTSDTETILALIDEFGVNKTVELLDGMFAFVLWDRHTKSLFMARDRIGEKPLYYGWQKGVLFFASEIKALKKNKFFEREICSESLVDVVKYGYVRQDRSIYSGIKKVPPGNVLKFELGGLKKSPKIHQYWSLFDVAQSSYLNKFSGSEREASEKLHELLLTSVKQQMISDVPVGAFLSGGIDSSLIVALMQSISSEKIHTFSIGYNDKNYNEADFAKGVAKHLKTNHTEFFITPKQALDLIPRLPSMFDEPFSDASQIPTFLVSALTRKHVKVALSGDGGDELFGGYNRYIASQKWLPILTALPYPLRFKLSKLLSFYSKDLPFFGGLYPGSIGRATKISDVLRLKDFSCVYDYFLQGANPRELIMDQYLPVSPTNYLVPDGISDVEKMMFLDTKGYLVDDVLVKVDRASMAAGLETRAPFLNHHIVEFSWSLPLSFKIKGNLGKFPLRQILNQYVPKSLVNRPKMGFAVPLSSWLRGSLHDWAEDLLSEQRLRQGGYLKPELVRQMWSEHLKGTRDWQRPLWNILMLQAWLDMEREH